MQKPVKTYIYKGNIFNFIVLTFTSLFQTAAMIIISLMLEKIMAIATSKNLQALYEQGIIFLILLASSILIYGLIIYLKPKYQKKAINQVLDILAKNYKATTSIFFLIMAMSITLILMKHLFYIVFFLAREILMAVNIWF